MGHSAWEKRGVRGEEKKEDGRKGDRTVVLFLDFVSFFPLLPLLPPSPPFSSPLCSASLPSLLSDAPSPMMVACAAWESSRVSVVCCTSESTAAITGQLNPRSEEEAESMEEHK